MYKSLGSAPLSVLWHAWVQRISTSHAKYAGLFSGSIQSPGLDWAQEGNAAVWDLLGKRSISCIIFRQACLLDVCTQATAVGPSFQVILGWVASQQTYTQNAMY